MVSSCVEFAHSKQLEFILKILRIYIRTAYNQSNPHLGHGLSDALAVRLSHILTVVLAEIIHFVFHVSFALHTAATHSTASHVLLTSWEQNTEKD